MSKIIRVDRGVWSEVAEYDFEVLTPEKGEQQIFFPYVDVFDHLG